MFRSLGLIDTITSITSDDPLGSHIRRSQQIDGIWVSADIAVKAASFCPFNFEEGDHRITIVDLEKTSLFGSSSSSSLPMKMCRLISSNQSAV